MPDGVLFSNYSLCTRTLYFRCVWLQNQTVDKLWWLCSNKGCWTLSSLQKTTQWIHFLLSIQTMCRCYRWGKPKQRKLPKITKWKIKQQKCSCSSFINSSRKNFENISIPSDDITCKTSMTFNFFFVKGTSSKCPFPQSVVKKKNQHSQYSQSDHN